MSVWSRAQRSDHAENSHEDEVGQSLVRQRVRLKEVHVVLVPGSAGLDRELERVVLARVFDRLDGAVERRLKRDGEDKVDAGLLAHFNLEFSHKVKTL